MKRTIHRSALVPFSAESMYALVNDVPSYPQFLPWCRAAEVVESSPSMMRARLELARGGVTKWFATTNTLEPGRSVVITLESGPFRELNGRWTFEPLGDAGCKVTLDMGFEFDGFLIDVALGPMLQDIFASLLEAFIRRAEALDRA